MLRKAVTEADHKGIIQYCSHHDEGWNVKDSWPASCSETKVIVACNEFGNFSDRHVGQYDYKVHGTDISAGAVPYLESNDSISGSSVATAIVAGVSSLMLSCRRMQFPEETFGVNGARIVAGPLALTDVAKKDSPGCAGPAVHHSTTFPPQHQQPHCQYHAGGAKGQVTITNSD
ncbi:Peptidase S8/S53, subtilisin/kexin/sedolisin [Ilyonectria robusta]